MSKPVVVDVRLRDESKVVSILSSRKANPAKGVVESGEFQYSLSIIHGDKPIEDYILLDEEVEMLSSDLKIKYIDDQGCEIIVTEDDMRLTTQIGNSKYFNPEDSDSYFNSALKLDTRVTGINIRECRLEILRLRSKEKGAWLKALKLAVDNPFEGMHLIQRVPNSIEYETVTL